MGDGWSFNYHPTLTGKQHRNQFLRRICHPIKTIFNTHNLLILFILKVFIFANTRRKNAVHPGVNHRYTRMQMTATSGCKRGHYPGVPH